MKTPTDNPSVWHEDLRTTVRMRCGKTAAVTLVLFTRSETSEQFRIEKISESTSYSEQSAGQGTGRCWGSDRYARSEFDWAGWYCPSCGHNQNVRSPHSFVRCGGCHELVCGFSIREVAPGIRTCKCFCGHGGRISGKIDSYEGHSQPQRAKRFSQIPP
jgi:hypothetical protein